MPIQYWQMEEGHVDRVLSLFQKLYREASEVSFAEIHSKKALIEDFNTSNTFYFVALGGNHVCAVFRGRRGANEKNHSALLTIAVDADYRGQGIGKCFIGYCLQELKKCGITLARAYVYSDNRPSINTLLSAGFTISGCVHQHHYNADRGEYVDDIILHKLLY